MKQKSKLCKIMASFIVVVFVATGIILPVGAAASAPIKGDKISALDGTALESAGYQFIDDRGSEVIYTWPYSIDEFHRDSETAYQNTLTFQAGQVTPTITYQFTGTYIAVAFAQTYYAAEVIVAIDGVEQGKFAPHNPEAPKENPGESVIVFAKDDLTPGTHVIKITHKAAHTSGEDNIKGDGKPYYDNDAFFDCFIVKPEAPEEVAVGDKMSRYDDAFLASKNLKVIDNVDKGIVYAWPYNLDPALSPNGAAYGGSLQQNLGQVSGTIAYEFEGTYFAAAFAETYYACKIIITIDGVKVGEITPHINNKSDDNLDAAYPSKVVFVKDDLTPGKHSVMITHEAAHTTGEDNMKPDIPTPFYDNNAMFDCFIVQADPNAPTATDKPTVPDVPTDNPGSGDSAATLKVAFIIAIASATVMILRKKLKGCPNK